MTANQIAYWQLQEMKRSNLENERIKNASNVINQLNAESQAKVAEAKRKESVAKVAKTIKDLFDFTSTIKALGASRLF